MRSRLGHRIVWYMGMYVREEHCGFIFTRHAKTVTLCRTVILYSLFNGYLPGGGTYGMVPMVW